jgi:hypothetical protein
MTRIGTRRTTRRVTWRMTRRVTPPTMQKPKPKINPKDGIHIGLPEVWRSAHEPEPEQSEIACPVIDNQPDCRTFTIIQNSNVFGCSARSVYACVLSCSACSPMANDRETGDGPRSNLIGKLGHGEVTARASHILVLPWLASSEAQSRY